MTIQVYEMGGTGAIFGYTIGWPPTVAPSDPYLVITDPNDWLNHNLNKNFQWADVWYPANAFPMEPSITAGLTYLNSAIQTSSPNPRTPDIAQ